MKVKETILKAMELYGESEKCDSKELEGELQKQLKEMNLKKFDGTLIKHKGKKVRIWHNYYGVWKIRGNKKRSFNWSGNVGCLTKDFEVIEEDNSELIGALEDIDSEITGLRDKITKLNRNRGTLIEDFVWFIDPSSFEETEEINPSAFNMGGGLVYIDESFCEITGERITS